MTNLAIAGRSKRRVSRRLILDVAVDVVLLLAFTIDSNTSFTGISVHEWLGIGFGCAFMIHLALHWEWTLRTARRLVARNSGERRDRARWFVDLLLYVVLGATVVSGWYVSRYAGPALGVKRIREPFFRDLHGTVANISVVLVAIHLGLNWRWLRATWIRFRRRPGRAGGSA
jgi:cytochrome b561